MDKEDRINQEQFYDIVTGRAPDWQSIIYELISSDQLDPWDIDIIILTKRYFEKIHELEETDFYISSKVLLAAAMLLKIKSDFLLNTHLKDIDNLLFGREEKEKVVVERIEINENDLPILIPRTPLPRNKRITLEELMSALNKAMSTETRRINRVVAIKRAKKMSEVDFPEFRKIDLKDRIRQFYLLIINSIKSKGKNKEKHMNKIDYHTLSGTEKEEKLACFLPILHLSNSKKVWLEQDGHIKKIWIYLFDFYNKNDHLFTEELEDEVDEEVIEDGSLEDREEDSGRSFEGEDESEGENLDPVKSGFDIARDKRDEKKRLQEEIRKELEDEFNLLGKEEKIDEVSGFEDEQ